MCSPGRLFGVISFAYFCSMCYIYLPMCHLKPLILLLLGLAPGEDESGLSRRRAVRQAGCAIWPAAKRTASVLSAPPAQACSAPRADVWCRVRRAGCLLAGKRACAAALLFLPLWALAVAAGDVLWCVFSACSTTSIAPYAGCLCTGCLLLPLATRLPGAGVQISPVLPSLFLSVTLEEEEGLPFSHQAPCIRAAWWHVAPETLYMQCGSL
jgi:hypothetical protein